MFIFQNGLDEIRKLQHYLELNYTDDVLEHILERCSIESLKRADRAGKNPTPFVDKNGDSLFFRKGEFSVLQ